MDNLKTDLEQNDHLIPTKTKEEYLADVAKYCNDVYTNCAKVADIFFRECE